MIYLDVTSSCKSPMNTGVQRVVRSLYRSLASLAPVIPLVWDRQLGTYCTLSRREHGFLVAPFGRGNGGGAAGVLAIRKGDAEPGRRANPIPLVSKWARALAHRWNRLEFPGCLREGDTLFVPEIFQDNRVELLPAWARRTSARLVAVCHDTIAWRQPGITPPERLGGFMAYLEALASFHAVVAVSQETRDDLLAFWSEHECTPAPVTVEPWPVNYSGRRQLDAPAAPARVPSVLCVGTFEPRKNHLVLLEAAERLWHHGVQFELVLIGRTTAQWGDRVLEGIQRLQAANHAVRWLRHVDDWSLQAAYEACAFTVFPSLVEGFGLPILESLWYGRACICGSNGAIGEVAQGGGCLMVDQTHATTLAAGMDRLLTDPAALRRFNAEAVARTFDTWEALAERLLPVLQREMSLRWSGRNLSAD